LRDESRANVSNLLGAKNVSNFITGDWRHFEYAEAAN
jgi:hypothetical protein